MPLIYSIAIQSVAMLLTVLLIPKLKITGISGPVLLVLALTAVNSFVWDASLFFTVPDSLTLHSASLIFFNGLLFLILVKLLPGVEIEGVLAAFIAPILFTLMSVLCYRLLPAVDWVGLLNEGKEAVEKVREDLKENETGKSRKDGPQTGGATGPSADTPGEAFH